MHLKTLEPCTDLWGSAYVLDGLPTIKLVENALYLPWSHGGPWGVFDQANRPVREALNMRTVERLPTGTQPSFPAGPPANVREIDETFMYLGLLNPHYGHFLTDSFSRMWPFVFGRARLPRLVWHVIGNPAHLHGFGFMKTILAGLGSGLDDIATFDHPIRFRRLLVPESSFQEQFCAFPVFRTIASRVGAPFYRQEDVDTIETPVFLSKARLTEGVGRFEDEQTVEDTLRAAGIDIVHPETLSFVDQVRLFAHRRCILATTGSALHTSVFGPSRRRIFSVNPTREINSNFAIFDALNRNEAGYYHPRGTTYTCGQQFLTQCHAPDPRGVAEDLLALASARAT